MKLVQRASRKKLVQGMETLKLATEEKMRQKRREQQSPDNFIKQLQRCTGLPVCKYQSLLLQAHRPIRDQRNRRNDVRKFLRRGTSNISDVLLFVGLIQ